MTQQQRITLLAKKYNVSEKTVHELTEFLKRSMGTFAKFDIEELGGQGRWTRSETTVSRDDDALRQRVHNLCCEIVDDIEFKEPDNLSKENTRRNMPLSFKPHSSTDGNAH